MTSIDDFAGITLFVLSRRPCTDHWWCRQETSTTDPQEPTYDGGRNLTDDDDHVEDDHTRQLDDDYSSNGERNFSVNILSTENTTRRREYISISVFRGDVWVWLSSHSTAPTPTQTPVPAGFFHPPHGRGPV